MSNTPTTKKTVKIKENDLVDLIDKIVNETVAVEKQNWINEQAKADKEKSALLETRLAKLEAQLKTITEGKK